MSREGTQTPPDCLGQCPGRGHRLHLIVKDNVQGGDTDST